MTDTSAAQQAITEAAEVVKTMITATGNLANEMVADVDAAPYGVDDYAADLAEWWSIVAAAGLGLLGVAAHLAQPAPQTTPSDPVDVSVPITSATAARELAIAQPFTRIGGGGPPIPEDRISFVPAPSVPGGALAFTMRVNRVGIPRFVYLGRVRVGPPGTAPVDVELDLT